MAKGLIFRCSYIVGTSKDITISKLIQLNFKKWLKDLEIYKCAYIFLKITYKYM